VQPGSELEVAGLEPAGFFVYLQNIFVHLSRILLFLRLMAQ
jgi:hypothetical protein